MAWLFSQDLLKGTRGGLVCRNVVWLYLVGGGIRFNPPQPLTRLCTCGRYSSHVGYVERSFDGRVQLVWHLVAGGNVGPPFHQLGRVGTDHLPVPWRLVPWPFVHPFNFFSVSAFLSTRRGPCRSEAPSTAWAAPGDHEPLIGGARWKSMGELRLGRIVTRTKGRGTKRQGTPFAHVALERLYMYNIRSRQFQN
jgi:hypothetical protein